jgi:hypothetical protein
MTKAKGVALVFSGIVVGCGAAVAVPATVSRAQAPSGKWGCYVADRFPEVRAAADWGGAVKIKQGLDEAAASVPAGAILAINPGNVGYPDVICVKY